LHTGRVPTGVAPRRDATVGHKVADASVAEPDGRAHMAVKYVSLVLQFLSRIQGKKFPFERSVCDKSCKSSVPRSQTLRHICG
jgi:hypothetical protein